MEKFRQKIFKMIQFEAILFQESSIRIYKHHHFYIFPETPVCINFPDKKHKNRNNLFKNSHRNNLNHGSFNSFKFIELRLFERHLFRIIHHRGLR